MVLCLYREMVHRWGAEHKFDNMVLCLYREMVHRWGAEHKFDACTALTRAALHRHYFFGLLQCTCSLPKAGL